MNPSTNDRLVVWALGRLTWGYASRLGVVCVRSPIDSVALWGLILLSGPRVSVSMHKQRLMHMNVNPIITARRALGLNRQGLATQANMAITTMEYLESGAYGDIPPRVQAILRISDPHIAKAFEQWKVQSRISQTQLRHDIPDAFPELEDMMHPHEEWRQSLNGLGINPYCETLKIQRNVVQNLERGRQAIYPKALHVALTMACGINVAERIRIASIEYGEHYRTTDQSAV